MRVVLSNFLSKKEFCETFKPAEAGARANVNGTMRVIVVAEFNLEKDEWAIITKD
jgi:hypothetical protein